MTPASCCVDRLPFVIILDVGRHMLIEKVLDYPQVTISRCYVQLSKKRQHFNLSLFVESTILIFVLKKYDSTHRRSTLVIFVLEIASSRGDLLQIEQHLNLGRGSRLVYEFLSYAPTRHLSLYAVQRLLVLADVVRHVTVGVYRQKIRTPGYQIADEMQMTAGRRRVERRPLLAVLGVDVSTELDEQLHHVLVVVYAALMERRQTVLVRRIRIHTFLQEPPHCDMKWKTIHH